MTDLAGVKNIFSTQTSKLVFAFYRSSVTDSKEYTETITDLKKTIKNAAEKNKIEYHEWVLPLAPKNGTPTTSPSAQIYQQALSVVNVHTASPPVVPALLAVNSGELCDVLKGIEDVKERSLEFIEKFAEFISKRNGKISNSSINNARLNSAQRTPDAQKNESIFHQHADKPGTATIDVAKMVAMGKEMMQKGQAFYAEKFFSKAIGVLDAVASQIDTSDGTVDNDMEGSIASTLAWLSISQIVQGQTTKAASSGDKPQNRLSAHNNEACNRLEKEYAAWITPLSDCARAVTLRNISQYLPLGAEWDGLTCSVKKISAQLKELSVENENAKINVASEKIVEAKKDMLPLSDQVIILRSLLVITYFLQGNIEHAMTEALKLHVMKVDYGTIAMDNFVKFLGDDNPLVVRSGWLTIKQANLK